MLNKTKTFILLTLLKLKWKNQNKNNFTSPKTIFPIDKVKIGRYTYGGIDVETYGTKETYLKIGSFCSIAQGVRFVLDGEHGYSNFSTYPFKVRLMEQECEALTKGPIIVHDDVWIGERSLILSGVEIGQGAVIAAGSVVTKNVSPYAIVGGNPARVIKYRFKPEIIEKLLKVDFSKLDEDLIKQNKQLLYSNLDETFFTSNFYQNIKNNI